MKMKILHIINDSQTELSKKVIDTQSKDHDVKVIELSKKDIPYETVIDDIFSHDKVISW